jgi:hypothetical protein
MGGGNSRIERGSTTDERGEQWAQREEDGGKGRTIWMFVVPTSKPTNLRTHVCDKHRNFDTVY